MLQRPKGCCFTGHRFPPPGGWEALRQSMDDMLEHAVSKGVTCFYSGGAMGFDMFAAERVLAYRTAHPEAGVRLVLMVPCADQAFRWPLSQRRQYERILSQADEAVCLSVGYSEGVMRQRNTLLVERADVCVAYCTRAVGGAAQTVRMAMDADLPIWHLVDPAP